MTVSILVTLDKDYKKEEAQNILNTLNMIKGVLSADLINETDEMEKMSIYIQTRREFIEKLWKIVE